jgi:hypothetical protein
MELTSAPSAGRLDLSRPMTRSRVLPNIARQVCHRLHDGQPLGHSPLAVEGFSVVALGRNTDKGVDEPSTGGAWRPTAAASSSP